MTEVCPSCRGARVPDDPDALAQYVHEPRCSLLLAEAETLASDAARFARYGRATRHRPTTTAERLLLVASGVKVPESGELFTRLDCTAGQRRRSWKRQPIVAVDEAVTR